MRITDFEIVDHGIDHNQYFQGCGTSLTPYADVVTGAGSNPAEAYDDAADQLASNLFGAAGMDDFERRALAQVGLKRWPKRPCVRASDDDCYYYISIRYNTGGDE